MTMLLEERRAPTREEPFRECWGSQVMWCRRVYFG